MRVLINKDKMAVVAKHESAEVLLAYRWIELPHVTVVICNCDEPDDFKQFCDFQLKELYGSLIGLKDLKGLGFSINGLLFLLFDAVEKIELLDCEVNEIIAQSEKITESYTVFKYVKGSPVAQQMPDLYQPDGLLVARDEAFENAVKAVTPAVRAVLLAAPAASAPERAPRRETAPHTPKPAAAVRVKPAVDYSAVVPLAIKQPWL